MENTWQIIFVRTQAQVANIGEFSGRLLLLIYLLLGGCGVYAAKGWG
jgi:hypothetical protein